VTWEYAHLVAHSFPIVLTVTGALTGLFGWWRGRTDLEKWGMVALVIAAAFAAPAYFTGLSAADVAADRTFVRPGVVQTHRFWATWALIPLFTSGALAVVALKESDRRLRRFTLVLGLFAACAVGLAAWKGSKIRHDAGPGSDGSAVLVSEVLHQQDQPEEG